MSNPILRRGFRTNEPVGVVQDQWGRQQQVPLGRLPEQPTFAEPQGRMTFDDVLVKSMATIGLMVMVAGSTFLLMPSMAMAGGVAMVGSLVALVLSFVVSMRRHVGIGGALIFAAVEGVFVGAFSRLFEAYYPGIVAQAVLGTFVAAGLTLVAYRTFHIKVGNKFRRGLAIAMGAYVVTMLISFVASLLGMNLGLFDSFGGFSLMGALFAAIGTILAVFSLVTDFDDIHRGVATGAPASESWRAAFGLTVTMVWLYTNIVRIISYFRN